MPLGSIGDFQHPNWYLAVLLSAVGQDRIQLRLDKFRPLHQRKESEIAIENLILKCFDLVAVTSSVTCRQTSSFIKRRWRTIGRRWWSTQLGKSDITVSSACGQGGNYILPIKLPFTTDHQFVELVELCSFQ